MHTESATQTNAAHRVKTLREIMLMLDSLASLLALHDLPRLQRSLQDYAAFIAKVADSIEETL